MKTLNALFETVLLTITVAFIAFTFWPRYIPDVLPDIIAAFIADYGAILALAMALGTQIYTCIVAWVKAL
jgi:hypothetical protein